MGSTGRAVVAEGLRKRFGDQTALDGLDLEVARGNVLGLLGPNGAGKTTAVRILTTLLEADGGRAEVAGIDVANDPVAARRKLGLVGQHAALDEALSGRQNLLLFGRLFHLSRADAARRADELLEHFGLSETGAKPVSAYSGGMRRRLDLAAGLILAPAVLFLDEPTTGLDPRSRSEVWAAVRALVADGTTVLLTTQMLEEADRLADRIALIDHGRLVAEGTPASLKARIGGDRVDVVVRAAGEVEVARAVLAGLGAGATPEVDADGRRVSVAARGGVRALTAAVRGLDEAGVEPEDVALRRPTLDEVFLELTGAERPAEVAA